MMHKGGRTVGGNMPAELRGKIEKLLDDFGSCVEQISQERQLRRAVVRSLLPCSVVAILDETNLFVLASRHLGMPSSSFVHVPEQELTREQAVDSGRWEFGLEDPFLIAFPSALLEHDGAERAATLKAIAMAHVNSEVQRMIRMTSLIQINPLFGAASYSMDERLAFVLMPFAEDLTRVYTSIVKPTVEAVGLVCRRADEFKTNKVIIQDIWKAICEARLVLADLTDLNPNVMYELGIAHTVGKETILIYQRGSGEEPKFPFDLAHIRRIQYEDSASGGKKLEADLSETLQSILKPVALS